MARATISSAIRTINLNFNNGADIKHKVEVIARVLKEFARHYIKIRCDTYIFSHEHTSSDA